MHLENMLHETPFYYIPPTLGTTSSIQGELRNYVLGLGVWKEPGLVVLDRVTGKMVMTRGVEALEGFLGRCRRQAMLGIVGFPVTDPVDEWVEGRSGMGAGFGFAWWWWGKGFVLRSLFIAFNVLKALNLLQNKQNLLTHPTFSQIYTTPLGSPKVEEQEEEEETTADLDSIEPNNSLADDKCFNDSSKATVDSDTPTSYFKFVEPVPLDISTTPYIGSRRGSTSSFDSDFETKLDGSLVVVGQRKKEEIGLEDGGKEE
ncbi:hypothetical protein HDV05_003018 [Chytridiales sp. JEL 0842]|nr:hypothetical protein HDV05_003018 [Chytridiales sp. JEL 0842]